MLLRLTRVVVWRERVLPRAIAISCDALHGTSGVVGGEDARHRVDVHQLLDPVSLAEEQLDEKIEAVENAEGS